MEEQLEPTRTNRKLGKRVLYIAMAAVVLVSLAGGGFMLWKAKQDHLLLPDAVASRATNFMPYFYINHIPVGYTLDEKSISFDEGVMFIQLTKPGGPTIVLTEQPFPDDGLPDELQQRDSSEIDGTVGSTRINKVSDRLVGTMVAAGPPKTLVLLSAPQTSTADLVALLQGLRPVRR